MIETSRLTIVPLTLDQLQLHVADNTRLEQALGLRPGHRTVVEPLLSVITHFTIPRLKDSSFDPLYHTIWIAIDRQKRQIVADAKFKGEPDETGTVEIGYGTYPAFQRQGYMSEIVGGLVEWASQQPAVQRVVADTDAENVASQKVLEKNKFVMFGRVENMLWWEYELRGNTT
ncbi:GNAT family N-acetyltransferase [Spirosoma soli]|uniref:GNAT family N-acetyltransferase n=1 Tax=Spirosoma soli TaxID=1770529 RepID=A0ABW5M312_9BACT